MKSKLFRNVIILCLLFNFSLSFSQIKIINDSIFKLDTDNISYIIRIQDGKLQTGYYGSKIKSHDLPNIYFEWRDEVRERQISQQISNLGSRFL